MAGIARRRVALRYTTVFRAGGRGVGAAAETTQIVRQAGDGDADRAVVGIMGRNCGAERDDAAFLVGVGRNRAAEARGPEDGTRVARLDRVRPTALQTDGAGG